MSDPQSVKCLFSTLKKFFHKNKRYFTLLKPHKLNFIWPEESPFSIRMSQRLESICRNLWLWKLSILSAGILSITNFGTEKLVCSWEPNFFLLLQPHVKPINEGFSHLYWSRKIMRHVEEMTQSAWDCF